MGYTILGDVHTHTLYSRHAYSTIEENVRAAAEAGLEILGSADHFSGMLYPEQHLRNFQYLINMGVWPRTWHGVTVLHGCEADVVSLDGSLFGQDIVVHCDITGRDLGVERTLFDRATGDADYVIASILSRWAIAITACAARSRSVAPSSVWAWWCQVMRTWLRVSDSSPRSSACSRRSTSPRSSS